jgi:hypothetical protein
MNDFSREVALAWSRAHASSRYDPIDFGRNAALTYSACQATWANAGDEKATTAALAALSIRPEVLQALALLASLEPPNSKSPTETAAEALESMADGFIRSAGFSDRGPSSHSPDAEDPESETTGKPNPPRPPCSPCVAVQITQEQTEADVVRNLYTAMQEAQIYAETVRGPDGTILGTRVPTWSEVLARKEGRPENPVTPASDPQAGRTPASLLASPPIS